MMLCKWSLPAYALAAAVVIVPSLCSQQSPNATPDPGPQISVDGFTYSQRSLFQRNIGGPDDMTTQFPPHKIIGLPGRDTAGKHHH
jgi:hypothetical protein